MLPKIMNRSPIVQKYGGSSVASIERLRKIAEKVAQRSRSGQPVVVVVSAMGKQTTELLALAEKARESAGSQALPERELDMLVSTGERITMALLSIIFNGLGLRAISLTGSQSGIITTNTHFNSRIIEVRPRRILQALDEGYIVVVAGYQGMSQSGEITTLGRGGSDTTAVALARALDASACEIYSDVDGVYSSDPRRVPGARHLPTLGYDFVWTMSNAGARVLNREAVHIARAGKVPVIARASFPETSVSETRVVADLEAPHCRAVVENDDIVVLEARAEQWQPLLECTKDAGIELEDPHETESGWRCWVRQSPTAQRKLGRQRLTTLSDTKEMSLVSLIGDAEARLSVLDKLPAFGSSIVHSSELRTSALVPSTSSQQLAAELHRQFVEHDELLRSA